MDIILDRLERINPVLFASDKQLFDASGPKLSEPVAADIIGISVRNDFIIGRDDQAFGGVVAVRFLTLFYISGPAAFFLPAGKRKERD